MRRICAIKKEGVRHAQDPKSYWGDDYGGSASTLPAVAGYPHLTVPMGFVDGLPVGMSFIGPAWSDARVLSLGYAFEQRTQARRPPAFRAGAD